MGAMMPRPSKSGFPGQIWPAAPSATDSASTPLHDAVAIGHEKAGNPRDVLA
jgi:hypothetical protein